MHAFQPGNHVDAEPSCGLNEIVGVFLPDHADLLVHRLTPLARAL